MLGANPLYLELGTPYDELGATASDDTDGDLSDDIEIIGSVDVHTEGTYVVTYEVSDAAGNAAEPQTRTIHVVVTPNSYSLIAVHSMHLKTQASIHSGFAGVVDFGPPPFQADGVELVVGVGAFTATPVRVSSPRVRVRNKATIDGTLFYSDLVSIGPKATIAHQEQVGSDAWPLFQDFGLPPFQSGVPGDVDIVVKRKEHLEIAPADGPFNEIQVRQKGTLVFTGGEYHIGRLDIGPNSRVLFRDATTLLIADKFALDHKSYFGPEQGAAVDASDILVYVEGVNGRKGKLHSAPKAAKVGDKVRFFGNIYAPNGTIHLRHKSQSTGAFIGKDVILGVQAEVFLQSGWDTPNVIYDPASLQVAKPVVLNIAAEKPEDSIDLLNYPNPFNPSTIIHYVLDEPSYVRLTVYNVLGQEVRRLVNAVQTTGEHYMEWDGRNSAGQAVAPGVYLSRLETSQSVTVRKMVMAK